MSEHIELVVDENAPGISAVDSSGHKFAYGKDMDSYKEPDITVEQWLGIVFPP